MQAEKVPMTASIVVVCAADNLYAMPLAVAARSALENLDQQWQMLLFVIDGGISYTNKQKIIESLDSKRCRVQFVSKPDSLLGDVQVLRYFETENGFKEQTYITRTAYYRLLIPELLPDDLDKAIYLDCDLVVQGDLSQMWQADIGDHYLLAVQDLWTPIAKHGLLNHEELDLPLDAKYFNSGILLLNLKQWRADNVSTQLIHYLHEKRDRIRFHDQDVLNAVLAGRWGELNFRWNLTPGIHNVYWQKSASPVEQEALSQAIRNPGIIHYAMVSKPWTTRYTGFDYSLGFDPLFFLYLNKTAWSGWRLTPWQLLKARVRRKVQQLKRYRYFTKILHTT
jgi:lipopolysaccharide biosynthesis glycosyltransferase